MGMTIDNIIQSLIAMKSVIGVNQLTINEAIETLNKYQKIEQIIADYEEYDIKDIREIIDGNVD